MAFPFKHTYFQRIFQLEENKRYMYNAKDCLINIKELVKTVYPVLLLLYEL